MSKPVIAVVGGTGTQGGGVVRALLERGRFTPRVLTRDPQGKGARALPEGVQVVAADLDAPATLAAAFDGAHGAFLVTNFWEGAAEAEQGAAAAAAAKAAGVSHAIWSTLPDVSRISGGELAVHHFTGKAHVDAAVEGAGFGTHTFVEAPFYFQNFHAALAPQPLGDGRSGWAVPMDPAARVIHAGDITDLGRVVARAFESADLVNGKHLAVAGGIYSWNDFADQLRALGHDLHVAQVPAETYDTFFAGAREMREMFQWFERYTYFGPTADEKLANSRAVHPEPLTDFAAWAAEHMRPS